jgi:hypothetical protein
MTRSAQTFELSQVPVGHSATHKTPLFLSVTLGATQIKVGFKHSVISQVDLQVSRLRDLTLEFDRSAQAKEGSAQAFSGQFATQTPSFPLLLVGDRPRHLFPVEHEVVGHESTHNLLTSLNFPDGIALHILFSIHSSSPQAVAQVPDELFRFVAVSSPQDPSGLIHCVSKQLD